MLGRKGSYVTLCICRLTLAWISSENSTTQLECQPILTGLHSLVWTLSHADSSLCCPVSTGPSRHPSPTAFLELLFRLSFSLPTSGHAEISSPKPFVWFRAKTDKGIVCLADHLHSVIGGARNVMVIIAQESPFGNSCVDFNANFYGFLFPFV